MRHAMRIVTLIATAAIVLGMAGCSLSGPDVSIEDRIDKFESDLSSNDWDSLYTHIHPDNGKRDQAKQSTYWSPAIFEDGANYSFSSPSGSGDSRTVTVTQDPAQSWNGQSLTFEMKEYKDGPLSRSSWYIDGISSGGTTLL